MDWDKSSVIFNVWFECGQCNRFFN